MGCPKSSQFKALTMSCTVRCFTASRRRRARRFGPRRLLAVQRHLGGGTGHNADPRGACCMVEASGVKAILQKCESPVRPRKKL